MSGEYNNTPDLSGLLSGLLANPSALSAIGSLLGGAMKGGESTPPPPPPCEEEPDHRPPKQDCDKALPCALSCGRRPDNRLRLLDALRPYLSPARCDMIDSVLRILELLELLQKRR